MSDTPQANPTQATTPVQKPVSETPQQVPIPVVPDKIHVTVRDRSKILFDEDVQAITSFNDTGKFDILPEHANFISVINKQIIVHKLNGEDQKISLNNGVLKVKDSNVHCYINVLSVAPTPQKTAPTVPSS